MRVGKLSLTKLCLAMAGAGSLAGAQTTQPLHFFVEESLILSAPPTRGVAPLAQFSAGLSQSVTAAERLLCGESKRVEKVPVCDLSFGEVRVTPFDRTLEDGLRRATPQGTLLGVANDDGVNFLLDQEDPAERRVYVVRRLLSCGGEGAGWRLVQECGGAPR